MTYMDRVQGSIILGVHTQLMVEVVFQLFVVGVAVAIVFFGVRYLMLKYKYYKLRIEEIEDVKSREKEE